MACPCGSSIPRYLMVGGWWCIECLALCPTEDDQVPFERQVVHEASRLKMRPDRYLKTRSLLERMNAPPRTPLEEAKAVARESGRRMRARLEPTW